MDFLELCKKRFSTRKFSAQKIDEQTLEHIMECVRMAPSAVNRQPWKFIVVGSESAKEKLVQCYEAMVSLGSTLCHLHEGYDK